MQNDRNPERQKSKKFGPANVQGQEEKKKGEEMTTVLLDHRSFLSSSSQ
jgi:hypothetical protein